VKLLYGHSSSVAQWVSKNIAHMQGAEFGPLEAIGVIDDDGTLVAGVVFHDYQPAFKTIQVSVAASTPRWFNRRILKEILAYPFERLRVNLIWSSIVHDNARAIRFNKGIGFVQEGVARYRFGSKHAYVSSMTFKEYKKKYHPSAGRREAA